MTKYIAGDIIQVEVVGSQPYGLFVKTLNDDGVTGLIHISEISYGFVKDVNQIAKFNDLLTAKILSYDPLTKHLKLSMKACLERNRYQSISSISKMTKNTHYGLKDFTPLANQLNEWIAIELEKDEVKHD